MTKLTEAQKVAQKKYDEKFPPMYIRLDKDTNDWIKKYSEDRGIKIKEAIKIAIVSLKDSDLLKKEVERLRTDSDLLKKEVELLRTDSDLLKKEVELLRTDNDLLKKKKVRKGLKEGLKLIFR